MAGNALPIGFSGSMRVRLPVFALVAVGTVLIAVIPFPHESRREISLAGVLFFALVAAAFLVPWEKLPDWAWLVIPIGYIAVIAIIRDAQGGANSGLVVVYLLPIVWLSLYGRRLHLLVGLFCLDLALLVPLLIVGPPKYPTLEWRQVVVMATVTTLVASTVYTMVSRDRAFLSDLAQQSRIARRNAREADYARDRLETLLRAATGSAIMGVDPAGTVTFFSAGAEQMLGYRAAEVVGVRSIADFIDPAQIDARRQTIDAMRTTLEPVDAETAAEVPWTATRKDGQQRRCVVRVRALPVPSLDVALDDDGDEVDGADRARPGSQPDQTLAMVERDAATPANGGYVVVAIDVTEREELAADRERLFAIQKEVTQSLIEQNNRLRELTQMKDDVVATVSHELRTPITSIRGFVELLLDASTELTESQVRMLQTIERNAEHLQRVAEDLLADPGAGRGLRVAFAELDLYRLVEEAVHAIQTSATVSGIVLDLEPGPEVPIFGDRTRLHQLLGNLLSNAIKFSPKGGRVHVVVDTADAYARVQVLDEGPGIPVGERDQLFERFYRLASSNEMGVPGTGLGLAIAKSVAEAHEGFVDIVDTPGWSTTFRVYLPLRDGPDPGAGARAAPGATAPARTPSASPGSRRQEPARLVGPQAPVDAVATRRQQLRVRALFHHAALVEDHDAVQPGDGGQPVGDDQCRGALHEVPQRFLDEGLGLRVEGRGGLVEHENLGPLGHRLGDGHALALPARELQAAFAHHGAVALGEPLDELVDAGGPADGADEVHVDPVLELHAVADVLGNGAVEHLRLLGDVCDVAAQRALRHGCNVLPVYLNGTTVAVRQPQEQLGQRGLARPRRPDEADVLTRLHVQVQPLEQRRPAAVREP
jgi:PAS domain S-box-containing protein